MGRAERADSTVEGGPAERWAKDRAGAFVDYSPAPESASLARLRDHYGLFIDGSFGEAADGATFTTTNPADGSVLAEVAEAGAADVDRAVGAAHRAAPRWRALSGLERGKYLFRVARIMAERGRELAVLETLDNGKPIRESRDVDVPLAAQHFFYYAGWADKLRFTGMPSEPVGVVGQIIPWNFPLLMAAWKIAPALACGNTVVLKPAETTPLTAMVLAEILVEAGLPDGVVNILPGAGETGRALVAHPGLDKVAFTGSSDVGRQIAAAVAGRGTRLTLELGGKGANIVYADADLERAVEGVVDGIFFNQGHVCCAGSRLLVEESIEEAFLSRLRRRVSQLRVGDPLDKNTDLGAINSAEQLERITTLVAAAEAEGAQLWQAGGVPSGPGYWFAPTIITGVEASSSICRTEVFGPVLAVLSFRTPEEAVAKANNTPYGLSAGVWSERASKLAFTARGLRAGVIWENTFNRFDPASGFGGYQESGYGREGGRVGLRPYLSDVGVR